MKELDPYWNRIFAIMEELKELEKQEPRPTGKIANKLKEMKLTADLATVMLEKIEKKKKK